MSGLSSTVPQHVKKAIPDGRFRSTFVAHCRCLLYIHDLTGLIVAATRVFMVNWSSYCFGGPVRDDLSSLENIVFDDSPNMLCTRWNSIKGSL